ncbi:hypothetical protein B484DRAFT_459468 [Ochromonadaceae sp. CCMP2298]|nr:hypothetical protein B484DRAFT_459468 [Ochromonadaceae sp. CCMP2298]
MALNERIVAAESCCFLAQMLAQLQPQVERLSAADADTHLCDRVQGSISTLVRVSAQLRALLLRASAAQMVRGHAVAIQETPWDFKKIRTEVHAWVPAVEANARNVWAYMSHTQGGGGHRFLDAPAPREAVWVEVCQAAFDGTIEGFARVRKCTAEGRSAMLMDLLALHGGLNRIHLCRPPRGRDYVEAFLRAALLPEGELLQWVGAHWRGYAYRHVHGLLSQCVANSKKLKDAIATIDALYERPDSNSNSNSSSSSSIGLGVSSFSVITQAAGLTSKFINLKMG